MPAGGKSGFGFRQEEEPISVAPRMEAKPFGIGGIGGERALALAHHDPTTVAPIVSNIG